jgi:hypothetical protein
LAPLSALCDHVEARGDAVDIDDNGNWVILSPRGKSCRGLREGVA